MKNLKNIDENFGDVNIKLTVFEEYAVQLEYTNSLTKRRKRIYMLESDVQDLGEERFRKDVVFTGKKMRYIRSNYSIVHHNTGTYHKNGRYVTNFLHADNNRNHVVFISDLLDDKQLYHDIFREIDHYCRDGIEGLIPVYKD